MKTIKIGKQSKSYDEIIYVSSNGSDSLGNGTEQNPFKTINQGISASPEGGAVVIEGEFEGQRDNTGFVRIDKSIDIIGSTRDSGKNLPVIRSLDHNTVQLAASNIEVNFYQVKLENYGNNVNNYSDSFALMFNLGFCNNNSNLYSNIKLNLYNCFINSNSLYLSIINKSILNFNNCIVDISGISNKMVQYSDNGEINFNNSIKIGVEPNQSNAVINFSNGIYQQNNPSINYHSSILEPNIQVDEKYNILSPEWIKNDDPMNNAFFTFQEEVNPNMPSNVIDISYDKDSGNTYFYCGAETYEYDGESFSLLTSTHYPFIEDGFICKTEEIDFENTSILNEGVKFTSIDSDESYMYAGSDTGELYIYNNELVFQEKINLSLGSIKNIQTSNNYIIFRVGEYLHVYNKSDFTPKRQFQIDNNGGLGRSIDMYDNKLIYHTQSNIYLLDLETLETIEGSYNEGTLLYSASNHVKDLYVNNNLLYVSVGGSSFSRGQIDVYNLDNNTNNENVINIGNSAFRSMKIDDKYFYAFSTEDYDLRIYNVENGIPTSLEHTIKDNNEKYFSPTNINSYEDYFCFTEARTLYVYLKTDFSLKVKTSIFNSYPYSNNSVVRNNTLCLPTSSGIEAVNLTKPKKNPLISKLNKKILACGSYDSTTPVQETWQLDPVAPAWNKLNPTNKPAARMDHGFEGSILFGGHDGNDNYFNDTWKWDNENLNWIEVNTTTKPPARANFAMTEAEDGNVYIYGGENSEGLLNDFWMFNGSDWIEVLSETGIEGGQSYSLMREAININDSYNEPNPFHVDEKYFYSVKGYDGGIIIYDKNTFEEVLEYHTRRDTKTVYSDDNYIYFGSEDYIDGGFKQNLVILNKSDFSLKKRIILQNRSGSDAVEGITIVNDLIFLAFGHNFSDIHIYDKNTFEFVESYYSSSTESINHFYVQEDRYVYSLMTSAFSVYDSKEKSKLQFGDYNRDGFDGAYVDDEKVYILVGGDLLYVYDKNDIENNPDLIDAFKISDISSFYKTMVGKDGKLYMTTAHKTIEIYDAKSFTKLSTITGLRHASDRIILNDDKIYAEVSDDINVYGKPFNGRRNSVLTKGLNVFGGNSNSNYYNDLYQYDKETNTFINRGQFSDQPSEREGMKVANLPNNETLLYGGENSSNSIEDMYKIKPVEVGVYAGLYSWLIFKSNILIKDSGQNKTFDLGSLTWKPINGSVKKEGITDLGNLIQNTTKTIKTPKLETTETGSTFSKPVNLKSFKTISNISII